jgi:hypothetical protein
MLALVMVLFGHQVPRPMAFAGAAHGFRENMDFDGLLAAVRLRHGGDADETPSLTSASDFLST